MAVLQANRIKTTESSDEKITPIVVVEEPESFLHPSAQSEFGRVLRHLSDEFGIQIVVTTHSPHMLNQEDPSANILLSRNVRRGKPFDTVRIPTVGENWMAPFADHLGIELREFANLRPIFSSEQSRVLLVEGEIDRDYFLHLQHRDFGVEKLDPRIEVVPYGGKDTLKNTVLVQFVLGKFDKVFITYDLDSDSELQNALRKIGLKVKSDFLPLGISQSGKDCFEGLLPLSVLSAVNGRETDIVMKLESKDGAERRSAKQYLKREYLKEFTSKSKIPNDELKELSKAIIAINRQLCK